MQYILSYCSRIKKNAIVFLILFVTHSITKIAFFNYKMIFIIRFRRILD